MTAGFRVLIAGVPVTLARKPSAHNLAWMRKDALYREGPPEFSSRQEKAEARAADAKRAMQVYADMLEISLAAAKRKIAQQHDLVSRNPPQDLSLEYDL